MKRGFLNSEKAKVKVIKPLYDDDTPTAVITPPKQLPPDVSRTIYLISYAASLIYDTIRTLWLWQAPESFNTQLCVLICST